MGGHPQVKTPNIDRLAGMSVAFNHAYCNAPWCGPSRVSALSGMYPHATGVVDHSSVKISSEFTDLPQHFRNNSYKVEVKGKVFHTFQRYPSALPAQTPVANLRCSGAPNMPANGLFDWAAMDVPDSEIGGQKLTSDAIDFMSSVNVESEPFFLGVGYIANHVPWYVPKKYFDLYPLDEVVLPYVPPDDWSDLSEVATKLAFFQNQHDCITKQSLWQSAVQGYLASISFIDHQVGLLLDYLESSPHASNTLVMLWSDNGFHLGEKFHWHKMTLWERSARVPLIIYSPDGRYPVANVQQNVSLVDMYPTLVEHCGLTQVSQSLQGRSLVPLLKNSGMKWDYPVLTSHLGEHHAVRSGDWCYIRYGDGSEELYNRKTDQAELYNLADISDYSGLKIQLGSYMPASVG